MCLPGQALARDRIDDQRLAGAVDLPKTDASVAPDQNSAGTQNAAPTAGPVLLEEASPAPDFMIGGWSETRAGRWAEEYWTGMRGGIMLGSGRSGQGDQLRDWEATRIVRNEDGSLTLWASPRGAAATPFKATSASKTEIVFANPAHDYPQRIRYWRAGRTLMAEISLIDGSKSMRWTYQPLAAQR